MKKIKSGDPVMVIAGKFKGKVSTVDKVVGDDLIVVKGINEVKKAVKGQGFVTKTLPIHKSNVMYYAQEQGKPVKLQVVVDKNGKKQRKAKKIDMTVD